MESTYVSADFCDVGVDVPKTISHLLTNGLQEAIHYPRDNSLDVLLHDDRWLAVAKIMGDFSFRNRFSRGAWINCRVVCTFTIKSAYESKFEKERSNSIHSSVCLPAFDRQRRREAWEGRKAVWERDTKTS